MDNFLGDIIEGLSDDYITKKIVVTEYKQIDEGMKWADICWFEWCDELVIYGSKLAVAKEKKVVCRLHRYESLTNYPKNVNWENVDKLIIVTNHLKRFLIAAIPNIEKKIDILTINNGVNLDRYEFKERKKGFNIAYVGYIHSRKNPTLLLQIMNVLVKIDKRYKLYVAGQFQDSLIELYWNDEINKMNLGGNIIFQGWKDDIGKWLENKNYILSTSIHESFGYGIAEAMSRGIKPIIHNFPFANEIWNESFMFNGIDKAVSMITEGEYKSKEYRKFIENKYSLEMQIKSLKTLLCKISPRDPEIGTLSKRQIKLDDIDEVVSIYFYGRSGSLFLQSLLDSHPNILMIPGDYIRFYYWFWNSLDPKLNDRLDKNNVIDVFNQVFPFIFNSDSISHKC